MASLSDLSGVMWQWQRSCSYSSSFLHEFVGCFYFPLLAGARVHDAIQNSCKLQRHDSTDNKAGLGVRVSVGFRCLRFWGISDDDDDDDDDDDYDGLQLVCESFRV